MSKKYQIINSNFDTNSTECTIFYLLYIVLFFVIIFIIYKIIFCFEKKEGFKNDTMIPIDKTNLKTIEMGLDLNARIPGPNMIMPNMNMPNMNKLKSNIKTPQKIMN